jgi:Ca-activated chloride channel homolog
LVAVSPTHAQFTSGVNLVEVYASVTDELGEPVRGLAQRDFELRENGELQTISTFSAGDFPLTVALALDRSFSMAGSRLAATKAAARAFLDELRPEDEVTLLGVGSEVDILAPLSTDRQAQQAALDRVDAFGTTGLHDAIIRAIEVTQQGKGRRALVILSDGNDRYSTASADTALARARASDVMVYPIAFGATRPSLFAELATLTGGRSYQLKDPGRLTETVRALARELRNQYLLGYTPSKPLVAGSNEWRSISVGVTNRRLRVRARDGYQVK